MNKPEIADGVTGRTGVEGSDAMDDVDAAFEATAETLTKSEDVHMAGFRIFGTSSRPACTGRNSRTCQSLKVAA